LSIITTRKEKKEKKRGAEVVWWLAGKGPSILFVRPVGALAPANSSRANHREKKAHLPIWTTTTHNHFCHFNFFFFFFFFFEPPLQNKSFIQSKFPRSQSVIVLFSGAPVFDECCTYLFLSRFFACLP
jgi:hypothetical protein